MRACIQRIRVSLDHTILKSLNILDINFQINIQLTIIQKVQICRDSSLSEISVSEINCIILSNKNM